MVWWVTTLKVLFALLCIAAFYTGLYFLISLITESKSKRRYKKENDIGRKRQDFSRSLAGGEETTGIRMGGADNERSDMENLSVEAVRESEPDTTEHREEPGVHRNEAVEKLEDFDYEKFKSKIDGGEGET